MCRFGRFSRFCASLLVGLSLSPLRAEDAPPLDLLNLPIQQFGESGPPPAPEPTPVPRYQVPAAMADPAFARYVDIGLLSDAYRNGDASLLADVALQLMDGERVLLRSHHGLKSLDLLNICVKIAADAGDKPTLDRLAAIGERLGDKPLVEKVELAKQLSDKPRAAPPTIPDANDTITLDDALDMRTRWERFVRARAIDDRPSLQMLQTEAKEAPKPEGTADFYKTLDQSIAEALAALTPPPSTKTEGTKPDDSEELVLMLNDLSGVSRGSTPDQLERTTTGGVYVGAKPYFIQGDTIYISNGKACVPQPRKSIHGLKGRFGEVIVKSIDFLPGDNSIVKLKPYEPDPDYVEVALRPSATSTAWKSLGFVGFKDTFDIFAAGGVNTIVAAGGGNIQLATLIGKGGAGFTYGEVDAMPGGRSLTFAQIEKAGGGNMTPPDTGIPANIATAASKRPGGYNLSNIVAAGGGNLTFADLIKKNPRIATGKINDPKSIVAAGGGNVQERLANVARIVAAGGGNVILDPQAFRLIGQDGASLKSYSVQATNLAPTFKGVRRYK
jgi:hypothetical protein